MKKSLILILIIIVLIIVALCVVRRRSGTSCSTSYRGVKRDESDKPLAKVNMILSTESKLLSYSIVLKNLKHEVESVHFTSQGKDIYQASGPRDPQAEGGEVIVHGLWREKSRVPITSAHINNLMKGEMSAIVRFKDPQIEPFTVKMEPK